MKKKYRKAVKLLGYRPLRDPDDGNWDGGPAHKRSWLLLRSEGSEYSMDAWLPIEQIELTMENSFDLDTAPPFPVSKTYQPSKLRGTFSGKFG